MLKYLLHSKILYILCDTILYTTNLNIIIIQSYLDLANSGVIKEFFILIELDFSGVSGDIILNV